MGVGVWLIVIAIIDWFFLVEHPSEKGLIVHEAEDNDEAEEELVVIEHSHENEPPPDHAISFFSAWCIPGVLQYSLCYFCLKFANYGIMYWLPLYLQQERGYSDIWTSNVASLYDLGTIVGGLLLGYITDKMYSKRSPISFLALVVAALMHFLLISDLSNALYLFSILITILGFLVGGVACVVSGIACADLGKLSQLKNNAKALATVTGIIDGTGSLGAALG